jgi:hypothetical protein
MWERRSLFHLTVIPAQRHYGIQPIKGYSYP